MRRTGMVLWEEGVGVRRLVSCGENDDDAVVSMERRRLLKVRHGASRRDEANLSVRGMKDSLSSSSSKAVSAESRDRGGQEGGV